jgi:hypothetical protein
MILLISASLVARIIDLTHCTHPISLFGGDTIQHIASTFPVLSEKEKGLLTKVD